MDLIRSQYAASDSDEDEESELSPPPSVSIGSAITDTTETSMVVVTVPESPDISSGSGLTKSSQGLLEDDEVEFIGVSKSSVPLKQSFLLAQLKQEPFSEESESEATNISDSESLDSSEISDHDDEKIKSKKRQPPKAKDELNLQDLPPIEDLHISVPHEECQAVGFIKSIVDTLVVVEAYPLTPAMDIDSVLFLAEGDQALGHIFDVFGPVRHPHYCVRFNSKDHMENRGVKVGELVYCAPKTPHTSYILLARLERLKGTDASWKDDHETPVDQLEFSDDEAEAAARRGGGGGVDSRGLGLRKKMRARKSRPPHAYGNMNHFAASQSGQNPYVPTNVAGFAPPRFQFRGGFNGRGYHRGRGFQQQYPPRPPAHMYGAYAPHYTAPTYNYGPPPPSPIQPYPHSFQQFQYPRAPPPPPPPPG